MSFWQVVGTSAALVFLTSVLVAVRGVNTAVGFIIVLSFVALWAIFGLVR